MRRHQSMHSQAGFSILELVIALGLTTIIAFYAVDNLLLSQEMAKLSENRVVLSHLEKNLQLAVFDTRSFFETATKNPILYSCLKEDNRNCPSKPQDIEFMQTKDIPLSGSYLANGEMCDPKEDCPLKLLTSFEAICGNVTPCDRARYIVVNYEIRFEENVLLKGNIRRTFAVKPVSDDSFSCEVDNFGRSKLAFGLRPSGVDCNELPELQRQISGVTPSDCKGGTEILAGFNADGSAICQPIKFSGGKKP